MRVCVKLDRVDGGFFALFIFKIVCDGLDVSTTRDKTLFLSLSYVLNNSHGFVVCILEGLSSYLICSDILYVLLDVNNYSPPSFLGSLFRCVHNPYVQSLLQTEYSFRERKVSSVFESVGENECSGRVGAVCQ